MLNYSRAYKKLLYLFFLIFLVYQWLAAHPINAPKVQIIKDPVIILDPGHGGNNPGAKGSSNLEKDINLQFAYRIKKLLLYHLPKVKVILTREVDTFLSLDKRAEIANLNKADLFISLHCNSNNTGIVRGAEVYIMGNHKSDEHLELSLREYYEDNEHDHSASLTGDEGMDFIFLNQIQSNIISESIDFGKSLVELLNQEHPAGCRPLRQAGFKVLWRATMPSVLIELGYINNIQDEKFLSSTEGQIIISQSIVESIKNFLSVRSEEIQTASIPLPLNK
ncbi:MAG: N-acetylmuramoyl-L-alanine amidase [Saprospiraceae bacterium]|nr:N-acetylmuramoyl-L-alanine amidase [Saprospiraceae bacterium]